jgi:hypothetical protein
MAPITAILSIAIPPKIKTPGRYRGRNDKAGDAAAELGDAFRQWDSPSVDQNLILTRKEQTIFLPPSGKIADGALAGYGMPILGWYYNNNKKQEWQGAGLAYT